VRFVIFVNSLVLLLAGGLMTLDAIVFPATRTIFLTAGFLTVILGVFVALGSSPRLGDFRRPHAFLLTASVWMTAGAVGAVPLHGWGMSLTDAFFESMSGITTTGSTVMVGLDTTPRGILAWRAVLQWIGGVGFIVTGIALLPMLRVGGMQLFRTESSERGEKELVSAARFARATLRIYGAISAACFGAYLVGGMSLFDAFAHAASTVSTGGYSTYDASFGHFESPFLHWAAVVFMLSGALPFAWYIRVVNRRLLRSEQVRALLIGLGSAIAVLTTWRTLSSDAPLGEALREVAFNVVSVVTTTGFATTDPRCGAIRRWRSSSC
jgi:trk system potassium uptake protein TrkH